MLRLLVDDQQIELGSAGIVENTLLLASGCSQAGKVIPLYWVPNWQKYTANHTKTIMMSVLDSHRHVGTWSSVFWIGFVGIWHFLFCVLQGWLASDIVYCVVSYWFVIVWHHGECVTEVCFGLRLVWWCLVCGPTSGRLLHSKQRH